MPLKLLKAPPAIALFLFLSTALLSRYLNGAYFSASLDEGIYLNGGQRIADGQRLYLDFFSYIGPLTYWLQATLFSIFGNHLPSLRWSTALAVGAICSGLFFLGRTLAGNAGGLLGSLLWLGIWLDLPNRMEVTHRWLSCGFFSLAMAALLAAPHSSRFWNAIAGSLMGLAIFTTPSFALTAAIVGAYFFLAERSRFWLYVLGGIASSSAILLVLTAQGSLGAFLDGLLWAGQNYGEANTFPFGRFAGQVPTKYFLHVYLGAICIPLALVAALGCFFGTRDRRLLLPTVLCVALFATAYPKWDAYSLFFISGPYFVLLFAIGYKLIPERLQNLAQGLALSVFAYSLINAWALPDRLTTIPTRAGVLNGDRASFNTMEKLEARIPAKSTAFVYPYLTGLYALLDVTNRARHDYLQPGMMTAKDEEMLLSDLVKDPPQFVFWQNFPDSDIKNLWPNSNPDKHRFTTLEAWIRGNYLPDVEITESNIRGQVWVRKTP